MAPRPHQWCGSVSWLILSQISSCAVVSSCGGASRSAPTARLRAKPRRWTRRSIPHQPRQACLVSSVLAILHICSRRRRWRPPRMAPAGRGPPRRSRDAAARRPVRQGRRRAGRGAISAVECRCTWRATDAAKAIAPPPMMTNATAIQMWPGPCGLRAITGRTSRRCGCGGACGGHARVGRRVDRRRTRFGPW
jgi:hypothetical protein